MTHEQIKSQLGDTAELRLSDNGCYLWLNIAKDGVSYNARLPLDPKPHHIEEAREAAERWWNEEQE